MLRLRYEKRPREALSRQQEGWEGEAERERDREREWGLMDGKMPSPRGLSSE